MWSRSIWHSYKPAPQATFPTPWHAWQSTRDVEWNDFAARCFCPNWPKPTALVVASSYSVQSDLFQSPVCVMIAPLLEIQQRRTGREIQAQQAYVHQIVARKLKKCLKTSWVCQCRAWRTALRNTSLVRKSSSEQRTSATYDKVPCSVGFQWDRVKVKVVTGRV